MVFLTFAVGNVFLSNDKAVTREMLGHDFLAFYTAGTFARTGQFDRLYDLESAKTFQHQLAAENGLEIGPSFGPYWNPPFYAWLPALFSNLPYRQALFAWTMMNLTVLAVAILLLTRMLPESARKDWKNWTLIPLLLCTSMAFVQAISHGQNTFMSLLLLTFTVTAWRADRSIVAGIFCGLLFYKPQLAAIIAGMLFVTLGVQVLLGLGAVLLAFLIVTLTTLPGTLSTFLHQLPLNLHFMQIERTYLWERHVTLRAFWRLLLQGREAGEISFLVTALTVLSCSLLVLGLARAWWKSRSMATQSPEAKSRSRDRLIIASILSMPLLMPFYFDYDLLLLSVPAVLIAGERLRQSADETTPYFKGLVYGWVALFLCMMVNPPSASASHVNGSVLCLSFIATLSILRAAETASLSNSSELTSQPPLPIRRAA